MKETYIIQDVISFITSMPFQKFSHPYFSNDEYIYGDGQGHLCDENGYYLPEMAKALHKLGVRDTDENGIQVWAGNKIIAKTNLVTAKDVELSTFLKIYNSVRDFFGQKIVLAVLLVLIVLVIIYIIVFFMRLQKAKKRAEAKRRRREQLDEEMSRNIRQSSRNRNIPQGNDDYLPPPRR